MAMRLDLWWWGRKIMWRRYWAWRRHEGTHRSVDRGRSVADTLKIASLRAATATPTAWIARARVVYPVAVLRAAEAA